MALWPYEERDLELGGKESRQDCDCWAMVGSMEDMLSFYCIVQLYVFDHTYAQRAIVQHSPT